MCAAPHPALAQASRIAVFRALQLGDMLCAVPALRALRRACPRAAITLVGLGWASEFARRFAHLVDDFVAFPGFPGLPETAPDLAALPAFFARMRASRFDVAVQMHGSGVVTNAIVHQFGARAAMGFHPGDAGADSATSLRWAEAGREVDRLLALTDHLGMPRAGDALEFPLTGDEQNGARRLLRAAGVKARDYVCVHPGARLQSRRWPAEHFIAVARRLAHEGVTVLVTGGAAESELTAQVVAGVGAGAVDLGGRTTLGTLAALIGGARLLLTNDTGVSHLAAALRAPSVVVSCGADPLRFAPGDATLHPVLYHDAPCRPCLHDACPVGHPCARDLRPFGVALRALALLRDAPARDARHAA